MVTQQAGLISGAVGGYNCLVLKPHQMPLLHGQVELQKTLQKRVAKARRERCWGGCQVLLRLPATLPTTRPRFRILEFHCQKTIVELFYQFTETLHTLSQGADLTLHAAIFCSRGPERQKILCGQ